MRKVVAFVAPTKLLVEQQRLYIAGNCGLRVRGYTGETKTSNGLLPDRLSKAQVVFVIMSFITYLLSQRQNNCSGLWN
jgi:hypothetical protein